MSSTEDTLTLWRPVGPKELELISNPACAHFRHACPTSRSSIRY
ncbi:hypothetical protein [Bradyrhizobium sp. CCBAU 51765]